MQSVTLDFEGSKDYLAVVGGFIRHTYFFNKKAFKFIGLDAKYLDGDKEQVRISTVFGTDMPETMLLKLNTLDLSYLESKISGSFGSERLKDFSETYSVNNCVVKCESLANNIMRIIIKGKPKILRSSDLKDILGECEDFELYSVVKARELELDLYLQYDFGYKTGEENYEALLAYSDTVITVDTLNKSDCKFGYTVTEGDKPRLVLNIDDSVDINEVRNIFNYTVSKVLNAGW